MLKKTPLYFELPSSYNIEDSGAKSLLTKTSGSEMM
jgi:hypothetical protein